MSYPSKSHHYLLGLLTGGITLASTLALAASGELDTSFGTAGKVETSLAPASIEAADLAIQSDGKIVQVGGLQAADFSKTEALLLRYNLDGGLDASFGAGGQTTTDYGAVLSSARAVKLLADGKILTAGSATTANNTSTMIVARYNNDGALDTTFGANGLAVIDFGTFASGEALAVQGDGKIVVAGSINPTDPDLALARLLPDGSLDTNFGSGGKAITNFASGGETGLAVAVQSTGKIVVAGFRKASKTINGNPVNGEDIALARFSGDGQVDTGFGQNGLVTAEFGDQYIHAYDMALQADDSIVVTGNRGQSVQMPTTEFCTASRFSKDGVLDASFGTAGIFTGEYGTCQDVTVTANGKILLAGTSNATEYAEYIVYQLTAAGTLDTGFGGDGKATVGFPGGMAMGNALGVTGDSKLVISGRLFDPAGTKLGLARLAAEASGPVTPGANATITLTVPSTVQRGQKQTLTWTTTNVGPKQPVKFQFSKNGGQKFKTLKTVPNKKGRIAWKPTKAQVTTQGVVKICVKPTKKTAPVCDRANVVVLPKS